MEKISNRKKEIDNEIKNRLLNDKYTELVKLILLSIVCAFIGYSIFLDIRYLILGIFCPWGFIPVHKVFMLIYEYVEPIYKYFALLTLGISAIFIFFFELFISGCVGIVALPIMLIHFILEIKQIKAKYEYKIKNSSTNLINDNAIQFEDEYYCEQCYKRIKKEDFKHYNCMCKECFINAIKNNTDLEDLYMEVPNYQVDFDEDKAEDVTEKLKNIYDESWKYSIKKVLKYKKLYKIYFCFGYTAFGEEFRYANNIAGVKWYSKVATLEREYSYGFDYWKHWLNTHNIVWDGKNIPTFIYTEEQVKKYLDTK